MTYNDLRKGRWSSPGHVYTLTFVTRARFPLFEDFSLGRIVVAEMRALYEQGVLDRWLSLSCRITCIGLSHLIMANWPLSRKP